MMAGINDHDMKLRMKTSEHAKHEAAKSDRLFERHSGTGRSWKESPKKGGAGGKFTWGGVQDEIKEGMASVQSGV